MKSRRRETRLAQVQDFMTQKGFPKARSQEVDQPLPSMWGQKSQRVLTYHEIPLLTLDWTSSKACTWGGAQADDLWAGRISASGEAAVDSRGGASSPGNLSNLTGNASDTKASACDVWQAFLTGAPCGDHSGVFESEWLQTATSVSPSDDPRTPCSRASAPDTRSCQLPAVALNRAGGTRVSSPGDDRSKHVSKCPGDRSGESHKIVAEQERGGRTERMGEESFTLLTADAEAGGSEGTKSTGTSRITGGISRKDRGLFSRPGETGTDEICPSRADSLKQGPGQSEGFGNENAASGNLEVLKDAGVETSDGTSQETERPMGEGLGMSQQRDGDQQQAGKGLQIHRGEHNRVPEPAQKPGEEEKEEEEEGQEDSQMTHGKEDVGFGERGSVLTHEEGRGPASAGRTRDQEVNSVTHTSRTVASRASQKDDGSQDDGETIRPLPNQESTADVGETRWLLSQDAMESQEEDKSNNTIKETDTQRPETSGRMEEDVNVRVKIQKQRELRGHAGVPQGEEENTPHRAEEETGTRDVDALHVVESELKKAIIRRFGEDLARAIWEEVFKTPDGRADTTDAASQALLHQEEFGSGGISSTDPHLRLSQCLESPLPQDRSQTLTSTGHVHAALCGPSSQRERCPQMAGEQEVARPTEAPSSEELKESDSLVWWSIFYLLSHITRLTVFSGAVVGLFLYFFLCDFPAFFAVYLFSLCCWFYKWKRRQVAKVEGMERWHSPSCVQTGEIL